MFDWSLRAHEAQIAPVELAALHLFEALEEAVHARGNEEKQDAGWEVTPCMKDLRKVLNVRDEGEVDIT